jgi:predicted Rossmann-fold nucleotide-binding protein
MSVDVQSINHMRFNSDEYEKYRDELEQEVRQTLAQNSIKFVLGIVGDGGDDQLGEVESAVNEFVKEIKGQGYAILTGGTEGGIPQLGVEITKKHDIPRIGVFPKQGRKYALLKDLDLAIEATQPDIGDGNFGTETPSFVNLLDGATIIGGSYGTLVEATTILKVNTKRIADKEKGKENTPGSIFLAPIQGTGGAADHIYEIAKVFKRGAEQCLPDVDEPITTGLDAARFLRRKLETQQ